MIEYLIVIAGALILPLLIWRYALFYRNPERIIPKGNNIVSPADGTVVYIKKFSNGKVPNPNKKGKEIELKEITHIKKNIKEGYLIGIFMNPLSVHVNRAPMEGIVKFTRHYYHKDFSMLITLIKVVFHKISKPAQYKYELENERNTIFLEGIAGKEKVPIYIVQIADSVVKKVVCWIKPGEKVSKGQRIGMIKLGSQVDLIIPLMIGKRKIQLKIKEGQYLHAGERVIGTY